VDFNQIDHNSAFLGQCKRVTGWMVCYYLIIHRNVTLQGVTLQDATLQDVTIQNVTIQDATLQDVTLQDVTIQDITLQDATLQDVTLQEALYKSRTTLICTCTCYLQKFRWMIFVTARKFHTFAIKLVNTFCTYASKGHSYFTALPLK
jgi:uncharacterized protein YjbI with pentapeptide repeats